MKLLISSIATLAFTTSVLALDADTVDEIWADFIPQEILEEFAQSAEGQASGATGNKAFTGGLGQTINRINEMSCWCYFNDLHGSGKGKPIDSLDEACKVLHEGYECAMRDAEDEGTTCVPWEVSFNAASFLATDLGQACEDSNPGNNCAARACAVEGAFINNLLDFFIGGGSINNDNKHDNGFSVDDSCGTKGKKQIISDKSCCGKYPERFPFKTKGGDRSCCGSRTFNTLSLKCCDSETSSVKFNC